MYLKTHRYIDLKRAFIMAGDTSVYLFTDATLHSVPCIHWFVYFCITTAKRRRQRLPKFVFSSAYSKQTIRPSPKLTHGRHNLGMSTSPRNDSHCPKLCRWAVPQSQTPQRKYPFSVVLGPVNPVQKFRNFSTVYACTHRFTSFTSKMLKIGAGYVDESPCYIGDT